MFIVIQLLEQLEKIPEISVVNTSNDSNKIRFLDKVILTYRKKVLNGLKTILNQALKENPEGELKNYVADKLQNFLKENWTLINGSCLSYTALKDEKTSSLYDITELLLEVAQAILDYRQDKSLSLLSLLMPGVCLESLIPKKYPHFTNLSIEEAINVLKSSILGEDGFYLIPAALLLELNEDLPNAPLFNYYFDFEKHPSERSYLNASEMHRLTTHSLAANHYFETVVENDEIANKKESLYIRLKILWKHLYYNSKEIAGAEEIAGEGVYAHLLRFLDYYDKLTCQEKIPQEIQGEINLLKKVISVPSGLNACLAQRQSTLLAAIKLNEEILKKIGLPQEHIYSDIKANNEIEIHEVVGEVKNQLRTKIQNDGIKESRENFINSLKNSCRDNLGLNYQLVKALNVSIELPNAESVFHFVTGLKPQEIKLFCEDKEIKEKIISSLKNLEDFIILISTGLNTNQLECFISSIGKEVIDKNQMLNTKKDLISLFLFLNPREIEVLWGVLEVKIIEILRNASVFNEFMAPLLEEQRTIIYEKFKKYLSSQILSPNNFRAVLEHLNDSQRREVYEMFREELPLMVDQLSDFTDILTYLDIEQIEIFCESLDKIIYQFIQPLERFAQVLSVLDDNRKDKFYHLFKKIVHENVYSSKDFNDILQNLNPGQKKEFYEELKEDLPLFVFSIDDCCEILQYLDEAHQAEVLNTFKDYFSKEPNSIEKIFYMIYPLHPNQIRIILQIYQKNWLPLIKDNIHVFSKNFWALNKEQRLTFYELYQDRLPDIIQSPRDFHSMMKDLEEPSKNKIYERFKDDWKNLIQSEEDYKNIVRVLNFSDRISLYKALKKDSPYLVGSINSFIQFLGDLDITEVKAICQQFKTDIVQLLRNSEDFFNFCAYLQYYSEAHVDIVAEILKDHLPPLIKNAKDLKFISFLNTTHQQIIFEKIICRFSQLIGTPQDINDIFLRISSAHCIEICRLFREQLFEIVRSPEAYAAMLMNLEEKEFEGHRRIIYETFKERLLEMITEPADFYLVLPYINASEYSNFCQGARSKFPFLIQTITDFTDQFKHLDRNQSAVAFEIFADSIPQVVKDAEDLSSVFCLLSQDKHSFIYDALQERLPSILDSVEKVISITRFLNPIQQREIYMKLENCWQEWAISVERFREILFYIDKKNVFWVCKKLNHVVNSSQEFAILLRFFYPTSSLSKIDDIYEAFKERLPHLIRSSHDIPFVFAKLSQDQSANIYEKIKDKIPNLINSSWDLGRCIPYFNKNQVADIFNLIKVKLPQIILSTRDVESFLDFDKKKQSVVFEAIFPYLPSIMVSLSDFSHIFNRLNEVQKAQLCDSWESNFPQMVKNLHDFGNVIYYLKEEKIADFCKAMQPKIPEIFNSNSELSHLIECFYPFLSYRKIPPIAEALKTCLPKLVQSPEELVKILYFLNEKQITIVCECWKDYLPKVVTTPENLISLLFPLKKHQSFAVCSTLKDYLPQLIRNEKIFTQIFNGLRNDYQRALMFEQLKPSLNQIIQSTSELNLVTSCLDSSQQKELYTLHKDYLLKLIQSKEDLDFVCSSFDGKIQQEIITAFERLSSKENTSLFPFFEVKENINKESQEIPFKKKTIDKNKEENFQISFCTRR